jgi:hypothetical protein
MLTCHAYINGERWQALVGVQLIAFLASSQFIVYHQFPKCYTHLMPLVTASSLVVNIAILIIFDGGTLSPAMHAVFLPPMFGTNLYQLVRLTL